MTPRFDADELRKTPARQYITRFLFGGVITVAASLIAKAWGPMIGGLFLAFPAVLPASLTFVMDEDGRRAAVDDARGARLGAAALVVFASVAWLGAREWSAPVALGSALLAWILTSLVLWTVIAKDRAVPAANEPPNDAKKP
jgi:uncharacterized membrane protein (GlpM family)